MTSNTGFNLSNILKKEFDDKFETITKNDREVPFSVDVILKDLIDTGLTPLEAIAILEEIAPHLEKGMEIQKIIQLINQSLQKMEIDKPFIKSNYLQPIIIIYDKYTSEIFNYRAIKEFLRNKLENYNYTSKTFKAFSEELYRIVLSLRTDKLRSEVLESMVPAILRNVTGINPFSKTSYEDDFNHILKLSECLQKTWEYIPDTEKVTLVLSLFESFYKIVLLNFNYLPGYNYKSTITQVNQLIAELTEKPTDLLSDKEIYQIGKSSRIMNELLETSELSSDFEFESMILDFIGKVREIATQFTQTGTINWIIIIDQSGNELYGKFTSKDDLRYKSLLGMAISGVQSLVNELTDRQIRKIDHEEGSILIERHHLFSVIAMVDTITPTITKALNQISEFVKTDLKKELENFRGNVSVFEDLITEFIEENYSNLFIPN